MLARFTDDTYLLIEREIPGIQSYMEQGWKYPHNLGKVITANLEAEWMDLYNQIKVHYHNYVYGQSKSLHHLISIWPQVKEVRQKLKAYQPKGLDTLSHEHFAVTEEVSKWIIENKRKDIYNMIQKDEGIIRSRTIHLIEEPAFMEKVLKYLVPKISKDNIVLKKAYMERKLV